MKKTISLILTLVMSLSLCVPVVALDATANNTMEDSYTITEAYQYPVVPGTPEWAEFETLDQMISACEIPDAILVAMSTEALIETVMSYPLNLNVIAFNTPKQGFDSVASYCNGLQELMGRQDLTASMDAYISGGYSRAASTSDTVKDVMVSGIYGNFEINTAQVEPRSEIHHNYTPNGTRFELDVN